MPNDKDGRQHFFLKNTSETLKYTYPRKVIVTRDIPVRSRAGQASKLVSQLAQVKDAEPDLRALSEEYDLESSIGLQVTFDSFPGVELAFESLANAQQKIELLNVKRDEGQITATVMLPPEKLSFFEGRVADYLAERKNKNGGALDHRLLIDSIQTIRNAAFKELWSDDDKALPEVDSEIVWWELWLPVLDDRSAILNDFKKIATALEIIVSEKVLEFPERTVLLARCSQKSLSSSSILLSKVSEIRRAKETAEFFDSLGNEEQGEWVNELLGRAKFSNSANTPYICILDTGVNASHPLITPVLDSKDRYVVESTWDVADEDGHGTGMSGLAVWGDLTDALDSVDYIGIDIGVESVKLVRGSGDNDGLHHGAITAEGVSLPEIENVDRSRVYALALSSLDSRDRGRPSAWSSAVDSLASDYLGENEYPRLFFVCAGNTGDDLVKLMQYPDYNELQDIHDPGQAWNAITVGGYTRKTRIDDVGGEDFEPLAPNGGLSPFSSTSTTWDKSMPIKPEVVFEAGNIGVDSTSCAGMNSLQLLTTYHDLSERQFCTFAATSAATALAANFAAKILSRYPDLRPETVRALMIHSAEWTEGMKDQFEDSGKTDKQNACRLVRCVGYGVPVLERALDSVSNSVVLVIEDQLQPFEKRKGRVPSTRDMHLHELPWPSEILASLGDVEVKMTITLSYFVEPNPSSRNVSSKYRYPSHQLKFDVKRPSENLATFKLRVSRDADREERGDASVRSSDSKWLLGDFRHKGSVHKDIWTGSAAELAARGYVAVYPAMGWWRTRTKLSSFNKSAKYSLVISIEAPRTDVDIYSAVDSLLEITPQVEVSV
jgi:Subtilase family